MYKYLIQYFKDKSIEFKTSGEQFVLKTCPSCGDSAFHHFYMAQDTGLWDCKKCLAKGNFNQYRKFFGDSEIDLSKFENTKKVSKKEYRTLNYSVPIQYASRLWGIDEKYKDYLQKERKLSEKVLKEFQIGCTGRSISIPIFENSKLVNIRYRRNPFIDKNKEAGPRYSQEKGCKPTLFNGDILKEPLKRVFLCEGEFDALQLVQKGFRNTVSVTLGAGYFPDDWVDKFKDVQTIYLVYDADEAGKEGAKMTANKLGIDRCKIILLPKKDGRTKTDITNYFVDDGLTKADFNELIKNVKPIRSVQSDSVKHISEFREEIRKRLIEGEYIGISTGYDGIDEKMGGMRKGRLIILSGLSSTGKTSMCLNIALNVAKNKNPIFYFSLEMPPIDIVRKFLMLESKLTNSQLKKVDDPSKVLEKVDEALVAFDSEAERPIYLYNGSGMVKFNILAECARIVKEEYGCQCIFVDHLHYFAHGSYNLTAETSQVVRQIKQLAIELDLPIVLVTHLNRSGRQKQKKGLYVPSLSDLRDTGALEQDADQVLFVCRDSENEEPEERKKSFIKGAKNRDGYAGWSVSCEFDEEITTFIEEAPGVDHAGEAKKVEVEMKEEVEL